MAESRKRRRQDADGSGSGQPATTTVTTTAASKKEKSAKRKHTETKLEDTATTAAVEKRDKKRRKQSRDGVAAEAAVASEEAVAGEEAGDDGDEEAAAAAEGGKGARFICFVGNLPYTATEGAVRAHFAALQPTDVRVLTERSNPKRSRGVAFVEFGRYDHMRTCLAKYHHSEFTDNVSPARKINVELTAGGGGKKASRMDKIKQKNKKLNEERARKNQEGSLEKKGKAAANAKQEPRHDESIHPSRRGRVPHRR